MISKIVLASLLAGVPCMCAAFLPIPSAEVARSARRSARRAVTMVFPDGVINPGRYSRLERLENRYGGWEFEPDGGWADIDAQLLAGGWDEKAWMAALCDVPSFSRGDTCRGTILALTPSGAVVDIGVKTPAFLSVQEMALVELRKPEGAVAIGDELEFVIISRENANGQLRLSRRLDA